MRKKLLSALLSLCMVLTLLPGALAVEVPTTPNETESTTTETPAQQDSQTPSEDEEPTDPEEDTTSENIAAVGSTKFSTLAAAISAIKNNSTDGNTTVTLLGDVILDEPLTIDATVTLDGDDKYTISASDTFESKNVGCLIYIETKGVVVTLKDITANANEKCRTVLIKAGKLVIDGATITGGATAKSYIGGVYVTGSASFEMTSGAITGNSVSKDYTDDGYLQYSADLWIGANATGAMNATISGGTVDNLFVNSNEYSANNPGGFTIAGGTIGNIYVEYDSGYGGSFTYTDGEIEHLYLSTKTAETGVEITPVKTRAYHGGSISAAANGTTMSLYKDISADLTIDHQTAVTLDLNGHTLTNAVGHTITNNGTLTIMDSSTTGTGKVNNVGPETVALLNEETATATLSGGVFTAPILTAGKLTITGGYFSSDNAPTIQADQETSGTISITGGHYSDNSAAQYLATGKALVSSDVKGYHFMVADRKVDVDTAVSVAPPTVEADKGLQLNDAVKDDILSALTPDENGKGGVTADAKLEAAANNIANDDKVMTERTIQAAEDALNKLGNVTISKENPVTIVVEPTMSINVKDAKVDSNHQITSLTLDIQALYTLKATASDLSGQPVSVPVPNSEKKLDLQVVTITVPLPDSFAASDGTVYVEHSKDKDKTYLYSGTVTTAQKNAKTLTFTNLHGFSDFVISADATPAASITTDSGTTYYQTLQEAVNDVVAEQTITLTAHNSETVTVNQAVSFTLDTNSKTFSGSIKAGSGYKMAESNGTYTFTKRAASSGGSGSASYAISVTKTTNGTVTVSPKSASKGEKVTITATPDEGYLVDALTATDSKGNKLTLTEDGKGNYTFTMPASKVTVTASFVDSDSMLPFNDAAKGDWFYEAVAYVYKNSLMNGTATTTFSPNATTTRGMIVTILYRLENSPAVSAPSGFTDVATGQYYANAVAWASSNNIVTGYGNNAFGPDDMITREQMASILYRYAAHKSYDVSAKADLSGYTDANSVSSYAGAAMQWANDKGLITGVTNTTLAPTGTATRAQVATILMRFCESLVK